MTQKHALEHFRSRLEAALGADSRIDAVLEAGSNAIGRGDRFSDLDLVIVATPDGYEDLLKERLVLARELGDLLSCFSGEHVGEPRLLICLFSLEDGDRLLHVDLKFVEHADLLDRVDDPRVLFDHSGRSRSLMRQTPAVWPERDPQWFEDRVWVWLHYAAARAGRGEFYEAIDSLTFIRGQVLAPMLAREAGLPQRGVRRIEQVPGASAALRDTLAEPERVELRQALQTSAELYLSLREGQPPLERRIAAQQRVFAYFDLAL